MADTKAGVVTHFFNKAMVAVVKLDEKLAVGDKVKISHGDHEFEDAIESMQINHESVDFADAGEEVAIKVSQPVKEGYTVYKVE